MLAFFSFQNFKNKTYRNILLVSILSGIILQSFLYPSLDYIALNIKNNESLFYNYATVAALALTIPQACSILISYLINNIRYTRMIITTTTMLSILSVIMLLLSHDYNLYAYWTILCGILINALNLCLNRQIYILIADKIKDLQSDIMLFATLGNVIGYKLSNLLFSKFGNQSIIICFIFSIGAIFLALRKIPAINYTLKEKSNSPVTPNIGNVTKLILKQQNLITFLAIMLAIVLCNSGVLLFLTTKIHNNQLPTAVFANIMSAMAIGGFIGAVISKNTKLQSINSINILSSAGIFSAVCLITFSLNNSPLVWNILFAIFGAANALFLINMNVTFAQFIIKNKALLAIAPLINGCTMTSFYSVSLIGPFIFKHLLQAQFKLSNILLSTSLISLTLMLFLLIVKGKLAGEESILT